MAQIDVVVAHQRDAGACIDQGSGYAPFAVRLVFLDQLEVTEVDVGNSTRRTWSPCAPSLMSIGESPSHTPVRSKLTNIYDPVVSRNP
jgi:hypothetical protein